MLPAMPWGISMKATIKAPRRLERMALQCHACQNDVEIQVDRIFDSWAICPNPKCGTPLLIRWSALAKVGK